LKDALNVVWEVEESQESGIWHFARTYVLSFAARPRAGISTACFAAGDRRPGRGR
jgi:hypothetical protein